MQRNLLRALLLATTILLVGALPAMAQTDEGVTLSTETGSVLVGLQNDVELPAGSEANAVIVIDGRALIEGAASGVIAFDSDVVITGPEASVDSIFTAGGTLTIENGATVEDVVYADTEVTIGTTAVVDPEKVRDLQTDLAGALAFIAAAILVVMFFIWIGAGLALLFSALLVVAFGTSQVRRAAFNIGNDILKVLVVGLLMMILPWVVIVLLAITIVGIPLAMGLAALWAFAAFLGYITVGLWIGERILKRSRTASRPYGAAFLGVLILMLLSWVPLVTPVALWFGLGAVSLAGWRVLRGGGVPPVPPGYGGPWGQPQQVPPPAYAPPPYAPPPPQPPPGQYPPQGGPPASWPQG
jgi:hypothetical protein